MLDGADTPTTEVAAEDADDEPPAFVAVTTDRIVLPTSLLVSVYELPVAPEIPDTTPTRRYCNPPTDTHNAVGLPDHPPLLVDSVRPSCTVPPTRRHAVFDGATYLTVEVAAELADADPPAFVAVTTARIVPPLTALKRVRAPRSTRNTDTTPARRIAILPLIRERSDYPTNPHY